jgi:hypothetical protein
MHFKLIVVFIEDSRTEKVMHAARAAGATGITLISSARGEGLEPQKTFFGLSLETQRDVLALVVEEHLSRHILEAIGEAGRFDEKAGTGIALQLDVEDVVGVAHQVDRLAQVVEERL